MPEMIKIAHSPDTDDIFMFYALKTGQLKSPRFEFDIIGEDIGVLNASANTEQYDICALSFHTYALVADKYALLSSGASMAEKTWGPVIVSKENGTLEELSGKRIAVPGLGTTACLILKMMLENFEPVEMPADKILQAVTSGEVDAGLVIHEGQIHFEKIGLKIIDRVTRYWQEIAGDLPLPLGCNGVRKGLGEAKMDALSKLQRASIQYAMDHRDDALDYARQAAPELSREEADEYLTWYANDRTLHLGDEEQKAIRLLFDTAYEKGLLPNPVKIEIV